jgi:hypothetical protein
MKNGESGMSARPSAVVSILGSALIAFGLCGLVESAWFWHTHTMREEPASPGSTPQPSAFLNLLDAKTEEERDYWKRQVEKEDREAVEEGRRDVLRLRLRLYGVVPATLLMVFAGVWMLNARQERRDGGAD